ncbi:MAG TPA: SRPBCC domain-containing protein [Candidatus Binataceae bacterium]|nr:SRPBCC domain-containing protein [Candidatus Binataceae bacterium]
MASASSAVVESTERELTITRLFYAPRDLVFKAWSEPERQAQWLGPKGFSTISVQMEGRVGGSYRLGMRAPDGSAHWLCGVHREIVEPERLVFTSYWEDADGKPGHETLITLTFEDVGGKTKLTLYQTGFESVTSRDQHHGGWSSNLDKLADYLATARRN